MALSSIQSAKRGGPWPSLALTRPKDRYTSRVPACLLIALALLLATACRTRSDDSSVLDKVEAARVAAANPSNYGKSVRIKGVVTYCDPEWHLLFLQDTSGGLFINLKDEVPGLEAGQLVEVSGKLAPGNRGVDDPDFRLLGPAPMPAPQALPDAGSQARLSQWVEVHGTVRAASLQDGRLTLTIVDGARRTKARILNPKQVRPITFVGAQVRVAGVSAAAEDDKTNPTGIQIFVSSLDHVKFSSALADPFYNEPEPSSAALDRRQAGKLVHLAGTVLEQKPGRLLVIKDGDSKVQALVSDSSQLAAGDYVELIGFVSSSTDFDVEDAIVRIIAPRTPLVESQITGALRTVRELKSLSVETAAKQLPVDVQGTVTFFDPSSSLLFLQDATAGVYVDIHSGSPEVEAGDIVRVRGMSGPGDYAPIITLPTFTRLGHGPMPTPRTLSLQILASGDNDAGWVDIVGIVHSVSQLNSQHTFKLVVAGNSYAVDLPHPANISSIQDGLLDAQVRVSGVCGAVFNENRQLVGLKFFVPDARYVQIVEPAPAESRTVRPIITLLRFDPLNLSIHRTTVRGVVTLKDGSQSFYVQDSSAGIYVVAEQKTQLHAGQLVEVSGFAVAGSDGPSLEDAAIHVINEASQAVPIKLTDADISNAYRSQLVTVEGRLLDRIDDPDESTLILRTGSLVLRARLQGAKISPELRRGSMLEVTGILQPDGRTNQNSFRIALPSADNIRVVAAASWWTAENLARTLTVAILAILAVLLWVSVKAYRVRSHQARHDSLTGLPNRRSTLEYLERQMARAMRERSPIGAILADVDHFKKVNDTYGHQAGDAVLRKMSEILTVALRPYDAVGRYGGEEFLIVVPNCDEATANEIAERMRVRIMEEVFSFVPGQKFNVTCSFGVAIASGGQWNVDSTLAAADRALYTAKNSGRNRVAIAENNPAQYASQPKL
jgi:diguanylate cyclase (GGDEF)-like protein